MVRHELVVPKVRNDGTPSGYPELIREGLIGAGIDGWTEFETAGYWQGKREEGITFVIFAMEDITEKIGQVARFVMTDQEAIQVVLADTVTLVEA